MGVDIGDPLPRFKGVDEDGNHVTSDDFLGSVIVIYFYLKDETPGCSREACDFRDAVNELRARGVIVIGISPDARDSHQQFIEKHKLNFTLLSDPDLKIAQVFGVVRPEGSSGPRIERTTFVVDETGKIRWVERSVRVEEHISRVLAAIDAQETA